MQRTILTRLALGLGLTVEPVLVSPWRTWDLGCSLSQAWLVPLSSTSRIVRQGWAISCCCHS